MDEMTSTLWTRWRRGGDEVAFEKLVRPELSALYDAARRWGLCAADAEDTVQEALTELAREASARPGAVGIGAWLMRAVRLKAYALHRSTKRRRHHESHGAPPPRTDEPGDPREVQEEVERGLDRLEDGDRQILLFRFLYDLDYREISYVLGVSENACRIRVHRASQRLKIHLGKRAPALLAVIPLADFPGTVHAISVATATHAAAGAGLATSGGLIMGTGMKMAAAAGVAAMLTAGALKLSASATNDPALSEPASILHGSDEERASGPALAVSAVKPEEIAALEPTEEEARWMSQALTNERRRRSAARVKAADGGLDILRRVIEHGLDPWPLLEDFDRFQSHVRTGTGPTRTIRSTAAISPVDLSDLDKSVTVVEFGPGTFRIKGFGALERREPIEQFEIRGAGKDQTILLMESSGGGTVLAACRNVRIHDVTLDWANRRSLLDVRDSISILCERVRFREWNDALMRISGRAYLGCRDCEFLDMDGRGGGFAVSFHGPGIASLERCTFRGVESAVMGSRNAMGSAVRIADCVFDESKLTDSRIAGIDKQPFIDLRIQGVRATYGVTRWSDERRRERWGAGFAREVRDLQLSASQTRMTLGELIRILRDLSLPKGQHLYAVHARGWKDGRVIALAISVWQEGKARPPVYTYLREEHGGWRLRYEPSGGGYGVQPWKQGKPLDLLVLLDRSDVPPDSPIRGVIYSSKSQRDDGDGPERELDVLTLSEDSSTRWILDARSGAILRRER